MNHVIIKQTNPGHPDNLYEVWVCDKKVRNIDEKGHKVSSHTHQRDAKMQVGVILAVIQALGGIR